MPQPNYNLEESRSVLSTLRALLPNRRLSFAEALRVAEWQATTLLELLRVDAGPVPSECVTELPRIAVSSRTDLPTSGLSYWDGHVWQIVLNRSEPVTRQRFTLFHEYKHIIDHGASQQLYQSAGGHTAAQRAEQAADFFAGCVLMPRRLVKRAWGDGTQRLTDLAELFEVSPRAMSVRLAQIGLTDPLPRCDVTSRANDRPHPARYQREHSIHWPPSTPEVVHA